MESYTRKDFEVDWFSGQGAGGQHRNKHQNCCRITHIASGLRAQSTSHRDRPSNQRDAFTRLAHLLVDTETIAARRDGQKVVRTYHFVRDEVIDHGSGLRSSCGVVLDGKLEGFREGHDPSALASTGRA